MTEGGGVGVSLMIVIGVYVSAFGPRPPDLGALASDDAQPGKNATADRKIAAAISV